MLISIDANNDSLSIDGGGAPQATWRIKHAHQQHLILSELLHRLDIAGVTLEYIDEDTRISEEW